MRTAIAATALLAVSCSLVPQSRFRIDVENPTGREVWLLVMSNDGVTIRERIRVTPQPSTTVELPVPSTENWQLTIQGQRQEGFFDGRELYELHRQYISGSCETFFLYVGDPPSVTAC